MKKSISILLFLACYLFSCASFSNQVMEMSLQDKVKNSDLVVIGKVVAFDPGACIDGYECAKVVVLVNLKGKTMRPLVLFNGMIAEDDPLCCSLGEKYIFFLKKLKGNIYYSTNGPFGVYAIPVK